MKDLQLEFVGSLAPKTSNKTCFGNKVLQIPKPRTSSIARSWRNSRWKISILFGGGIKTLLIVRISSVKVFYVDGILLVRSNNAGRVSAESRRPLRFSLSKILVNSYGNTVPMCCIYSICWRHLRRSETKHPLVLQVHHRWNSSTSICFCVKSHYPYSATDQLSMTAKRKIGPHPRLSKTE